MGAGAVGGAAAGTALSESTPDELSTWSQGLPKEIREKLVVALSTSRKSFVPEKLESASDLVNQVSAKKISCAELVEKSLARLTATKELNACVHVYADEARAKAKAVDEKIAAGGALGALEGLPIVVKANFDVAGTVTDASNPVMKDFVPNTTAPTIQPLLDAGAIMIAKTNMPTNARNMTPWSPIHGQCFNPVNLANTPGGSSSGTAAAIAAGIVSTGMGSDTGGSCRLPAICVGIVGFRPSPGRYSNDGCVPCVPTADTPGPLGSCVRDIMLMDSVITGTKHDFKEGSAVTDVLKGLKISLPLDWIGADQFLNKTVTVSWHASIGALTDHGVDFVKMDIDNAQSCKPSIASFMKSGWDALDAYLEKHRKSGVKHAALELSTKDFVAQSPKGEDAVFRAPDEDPEKEKAAKEAFEAGVKAAEEFITAYFAKTGARFMLTPAGTGLAPNIEKGQFDGHVTVTGYRLVAETMKDEEPPMSLFPGGILSRYGPRWAGFLTSIAITTPIKCQATGLSTGIILWGPKDSDADLLQAAAAVEAAFAAIDTSKHTVSY